MKQFFLASLFLVSGLVAHAQTFSRGEHVYDRVFRTVMYIEDIDSNYYYVRYFRGNETSYPRYAQDLAKSVDSFGRIHVGMDVAYQDMNTRQWQHDTVKYVFDNGIAWFKSPIGNYGVGVNHLGVETGSIPGSKLKIGEVACPIERTTHHRAPGSRGVVTKFYDNGAALMKFKDFLIVNAWEVVPVKNLKTDCK